jgi:hypothetical protein
VPVHERACPERAQRVEWARFQIQTETTPLAARLGDDHE